MGRRDGRRVKVGQRLREPLPLYCKTSAARARGAGAAGEWESGWDVEKEDKEPEHLLVLGGQRPFEAIDTPRFDAYARRLWDGIRRYERVEEL